MQEHYTTAGQSHNLLTLQRFRHEVPQALPSSRVNSAYHCITRGCLGRRCASADASVTSSSRVRAAERHTDAMSAFEEVRREFTVREMSYDSTLVTLGLAELYLRDGRTREVRALAEEMVWTFRIQGIYREALGALQLFFEAAWKEATTGEMARRLGHTTHRATPACRSRPEWRDRIEGVRL